jgi:hypothetical protein
LVAAPEACDSWKEWAAAVKAAAEGELEEGASGKLMPAAIRGLLQVGAGLLPGAVGLGNPFLAPPGVLVT